jgi:hypothetical protein
MTRYTPEFIAALRHRYEDTDQPLRLIVAEFKISETALYKLIQKEGWTLRSRRMRDVRPASRLIEDVVALADRPGAAGAAEAHTAAAAPPALDKTTDPSAAALARVEAYLLKRLAAEEAARDEAGDGERSARTVSILIRALQSLRELRGEATPAETIDDDDDMPRDIDEFRRDLARRIDAFVASRTNPADAGGDSTP